MVTSDWDLSDALVEILSKLPVQTLLRFKGICKSWYDLVEDPDFISKHMKGYSDDHTILIIHYMDAKVQGVKYALSLFLDETLMDLSYEDFDSRKPVQGQIMGPFDGIFCLYGFNRVTLWNPATKEFQTLPKCRTSLPPYKKLYYPSVGFGKDPRTQEYKLVLTRALWDEGIYTLHDYSHVAVYCLNTRSWREFQGNGLIHYCMHSMYYSTYWNGICYWLASQETLVANDGDNTLHIIISFHMGDEVFQEIETPCTLDDSFHGILGLYHNSLALLLLDTNDNFINIWVMKENCWIKQLTCGPILGVLGPLAFWKNGTFFIVSRIGQVLLYDPDTEEARDIGLRTITPEVLCYKESLIKLSAEDDSLESMDIQWDVLGVYNSDLV